MSIFSTKQQKISNKEEFLFDPNQFKKELDCIDVEKQEFLSNLKELLEHETYAIRAFA